MNPSNVYFILDHPQNGENVGGAARAMANFGFANLRLVRPKNMQRAERVACEGNFVVKEAARFDSLEDALADLSLAVGTSGRKLGLENLQPVPPQAAASEMAGLSGGDKVGIVFGCEASGITQDDLLSCDLVSSIPTTAECPSVNLAQAVGLYAWEIAKHRPGQLKMPAEGLATHQQKNLLRAKAEELLDLADMRPPGRRQTLVQGLMRFLRRRPLAGDDATFLMRFLNQVNKKLSGRDH